MGVFVSNEGDENHTKCIFRILHGWVDERKATENGNLENVSVRITLIEARQLQLILTMTLYVGCAFRASASFIAVYQFFNYAALLFNNLHKGVSGKVHRITEQNSPIMSQ